LSIKLGFVTVNVVDLIFSTVVNNMAPWRPQFVFTTNSVQFIVIFSSGVSETVVTNI
jgi:hypothetical protein